MTARHRRQQCYLQTCVLCSGNAALSAYRQPTWLRPSSLWRTAPGRSGDRESQSAQISLRGMLKPFAIKPKDIKFPSGRVLKGYERGELEDAFSRYLPPIELSLTAHPPDQTATTATAAEFLGYSPVQSATEEGEVAVEHTLEPPENSQSSGVAVEKGGCGRRVVILTKLCMDEEQ